MQGARKLLWIFGPTVAVVCILGALYWFNNNLNPHYIAAKCERRVEASIDPATLRSWATNLLARYPAAKTNYGGPFPAMPGLKKIWEKSGPSVSILGGDAYEEEFVFVAWGAAAGHCGLSIGSPSFKPYIPEHGSRMWKPSVYFWRNFH